jgi:hypothetical protein
LKCVARPCVGTKNGASAGREARDQRRRCGRIVDLVQDGFEDGVDAGMRLAFGEQAAQCREMDHSVNRMSRGEKRGSAQVQAFHRIIAEMLVEPRPPGGA